MSNNSDSFLNFKINTPSVNELFQEMKTDPTKRALCEKVKSNSSKVLKMVEFNYEHNIFDKVGGLAQASSNFITAEDDAFQYLWNFNYSITASSSDSIKASTTSPNAGIVALPRDSPFKENKKNKNLFATTFSTPFDFSHGSVPATVTTAASFAFGSSPAPIATTAALTSLFGSTPATVCTTAPSIIGAVTSPTAVPSKPFFDFNCRKNQNFVIQKIELRTGEKLNNGDVAKVIIIVNDKVLLYDEFDSKNHSSPLSIEKNIADLTISNCNIKDAHILIKIKIYSHCDSSIQMVEDYTKFFENESLSNVKFVFGDVEISAHKQILSARNSEFRKMFESDNPENENGRVEITDVEPKIFKLMLQFIYTGNFVSDEFSDWLKLLTVAEKYSITRLMKTCEHRIFNNLTSDNIIDAFVTADLVKAEDLKKTCVELIFKNKRKVVATEAYKNLIKSRPDLATKMLRYSLEKLD